jgi:FkbM family methyltransferase
MAMLKLLIRILGRSLSWRLGRAIYMAARGESANDMETNGERLLVERIARHLASVGSAEQPVIVDCGANLGDWSAMTRREMAAAGATASYHLMEPSPETFRSISNRFAGQTDMRLHAVALSDHDGTADFFMVAPTGGRNSLVDSEHETAEKISVKLARGSDFFAALGVDRIALVKIDTEGHDFAVIEGFSEMLASRRIQVVQFEYNFRWLSSNRSMRDVFSLAKRHGYRVGKADADDIYVYQSWNAENDRFFEWNYLLIAPEMLASLGAREMRWGESNTLIDDADS